MSAGDLLLPFTVPVLRDAFLVTALIAAACALVSCFLVLKGWALMGDAISHAVLPGVVVSYTLGIPLAAGAFAAGLAAALSVGYLNANSRIREDTVIGVVFSGFFAAGLVLYTRVDTNVHLDHILFGDMLGLLPEDRWLAVGIAALTLVLTAAKWRDMMLESFDATQARAIGLSVRALGYGFLALLSLVVVGALKSIGIILSVALLIAPGAIAFLLCDRLQRMLVVAPLVAVGAALVGIYASIFVDAAPGPTIVLMLTVAFIAAFLFAPKRGVLVARRARRHAITAAEPI